MTNTANLLSKAPPGEVTVEGDRMRVVFRRRYAKPVAKVWAALATAERIEDWFGAAKIDLRVGGSLTLTFVDGAHRMALGITRVDPPHALAWSWNIDGLDTSVLFELAADGDGCLLTLTHSGINARGRGLGVRAGWHAHLEGLADALDGRATTWAVKEQREAAAAPFYPPLPAVSAE